MANTYTQIHIHIIFAVKYKAALIQPEWKYELYNYISRIIIENNHKLIVVNGMSDHIHIVLGMRPTQALSDLMKQIKGASSGWINEKKLTKTHFNWQDGYAAFSYGKSQLGDLIQYVKSQEEHHKKISFTEECRKFLDLFEIEFDEKYILSGPE